MVVFSAPVSPLSLKEFDSLLPTLSVSTVPGGDYMGIRRPEFWRAKFAWGCLGDAGH